MSRDSKFLLNKTQSKRQDISVRYACRMSWLSFFKTVLLSAVLILSMAYFFDLYALLVYWVSIFLIWAWIRFRKIQKIKKLENLALPQNIWKVFYSRHPNLKLVEQEIILDGFKDYLALHILKRKDYAMPSHAVDALWHVLLECYPEDYRAICQEFLGFELKHQPHPKQSNPTQKLKQQRQLLNTWEASCQLQHLQYKYTDIFPRLFQVDQKTHWDNGAVFSMIMILSLYDQMNKNDSDTTSSNTTSCSSNTSSSSDSNDTRDHSHSSNSDTSSCSSCSSCGSGGGD